MPAPSTGLSRVTISSPQRRVDVALPDGVPLAELLPELLSHAGEGLADDGEKHGGWALRRADGSPLSADAPLSTQGVRDGAVLHLVPARTQWPELEYDDVVEAIAAGARRYGASWSGRASRVAGLASAGLALAVGLAAILRSGPAWTVPALGALAVAAVLLVTGAVASRAYGDGPVGATLAAYALPYAFVGGLLVLAPEGPLTGLSVWHLLVASMAVLLAALVGAFGAGYALRVFIAGATAGVLGAAAALVGAVTSANGAAAAVLTLLVTGVGAVPLLAIRFGKLPMPAITLPGDLSEGGRGLAPLPERDKVFAAVGRTDEMLSGMLTGLSVVAIVASLVLARADDFAARLLVVVAAVAFLLRARLFVTIRQRLPLLAAGVAGLGLLASGIGAGSDPMVRVVGALVLALVAVAVAVAGARYAERVPSPYLGRTADIVDALCVVAALPVACAILGLYGLARGLLS